MDYGDIIAQAWRLAWKHKWLWLASLVAVLGVGGNTAGIGAPSGVAPSGVTAASQITPDRLIVILGIGSVLLLVGIILWIASVVGRGALIAGVNRLDRDGVCTPGQAWSEGMENFGRLFLIGLVTAAPGLALAFLTFVAAVPAMTGAYFGDAGLGGVISATVVACFLPLCCVLALAGLGLGLIQHFADRAAVLEGLPPGPALRRGWAVLRSHLSEALVLFIVWMVVSWFFQIVSVTVVALSIPAILALVAGGGVGFGALLLVFISALIGVVAVSIFSIFNTFTSALWTLAYRRFIAE